MRDFSDSKQPLSSVSRFAQHCSQNLRYQVAVFKVDLIVVTEFVRAT